MAPRLPLVFATALASAAAAAQPNFVFILSDDLGYGEISIMPGRTNTNISTPNIDSLFLSGTRFTNAYTGEAVCAPSRNSLMTGQHTGHTWIRGNLGGPAGHGLPLRPQDTTFLELIQAEGYNVACVGKWGLGWVDDSGAPHLKGCSSYFGVLDQNLAHNMYPALANYTWRYPASDGSLTYESIAYPNNANASRATCMATPSPCTWTHDLWTNAALAAIQQQADAEDLARRGLAPEPKPLFVYLAYTDPHAGGWTGTEEQGNPVPSDGRFANETAWPDAEKDHASVIENFQDVDVGRIVSLLTSTGLRDNTAVFYASDNGASNEGNHDYNFFGSSGPLRGFKRCLFEGGIRTPFAVSWPGTVPAGVVSDDVIAFWDVMPTVLDMAGIPASKLPSGIDGTSQWPVIMGTAPADYAHPPLYWEFCTGVHAPGVPAGVGWGHAVRNGTWKAVSFFKDTPFALYDLSSDLGETTDLAKKHPDIVAALEAFAVAAHVDNPNFPVKNCVSS
jgi:arylsulfatase A-like enzyme